MSNKQRRTFLKIVCAVVAAIMLAGVIFLCFAQSSLA